MNLEIMAMNEDDSPTKTSKKLTTVQKHMIAMAVALIAGLSLEASFAHFAHHKCPCTKSTKHIQITSSQNASNTQ
jgi:hypothetical protein